MVKPGLTWSQKLGVAIGLLVDNNKSYLVENVKDTLRTASAARTAIVLITDGNPDGGNDFDLQAWLDEPKEVISDSLKEQLSKPSQAALEKFEDHGAHSVPFYMLWLVSLKWLGFFLACTVIITQLYRSQHG